MQADKTRKSLINNNKRIIFSYINWFFSLVVGLAVTYCDAFALPPFSICHVIY